jgi:hypothetical protein
MAEEEEVYYYTAYAWQPGLLSYVQDVLLRLYHIINLSERSPTVSSAQARAPVQARTQHIILEHGTLIDLRRLLPKLLEFQP